MQQTTWTGSSRLRCPRQRVAGSRTFPTPPTAREKEEDSSQQLLGSSKPPQLLHHQPHLRATKRSRPKRTPSLAGFHGKTGRRKETKTCESSSPELQVLQCKPLILPRLLYHSPGGSSWGASHRRPVRTFSLTMRTT